MAWALVGASGVCCAQTNPPMVTSQEWFTWYQNLLNQRLAECPRARGHTYYFSQLGNDQTGNGSIASPWKSLAKAREVLSAPAGDVAVLFRRGDVWRETPGLDIGTPNITIADYGTGEKPLLTAFTSVGSPALWSPTAGVTGVYERPAPVQVTCAKQDEDLDRPWSRQQSVAGVQATEGSWYWKKGVLYVHPRHGAGGIPTDPRVDGNAYEVVAIPDVQASPGVRLRGDGSRVENLKGQGWGITVQPGTQLHAFESRVEGAGRAVIIGCEGHYGLSHVITHWSGTGGIATIVNCKAGLCMNSGDGVATIFNTYAYNGGCETIFDGCEATHGITPDGALPPNRRNGFGLYGHTNASFGAYLGLTIVNNFTTRDTKYGCAIGAQFADVTPAPGLDSVRCFIVGEKFQGGLGTGRYWFVSQDGVAKVNGVYSFQPEPGGVPWFNGWAGGWLLNSTVKVDCRNANGDFSLFTGNPTVASRMQAWNCQFEFATRPGQTVRFDGSTPQTSAGSAVANSVIVCTGGGVCNPNLGVSPPVQRKRGQPAWPLKSNAYFGVAPAAVSKDPYAIVLAEGEWPGDTPSCVSPLACGARNFPSGFVMAYDQHGVGCWRNDVGPVETPWCANCDGSTTAPVLNAGDFQCFLNLFSVGDPAANCDGSTVAPVVNAADFVCFQNAFARGCR